MFYSLAVIKRKIIVWKVKLRTFLCIVCVTFTCAPLTSLRSDYVIVFSVPL